jgi:hypothetical protein
MALSAECFLVFLSCVFAEDGRLVSTWWSCSRYKLYTCHFDYNQGRQNNTIGKVLYIAISAADPSKPTMSAVSVRFDNNNWITKQVRNEWWTGDKSITMSPMITAMYWYASPNVEIPLSDLQFAAECLVQC